MKVQEMQESLNLEMTAGEKGLDREISGGYCGDLLSDVMANSSAGQVWLTIQSHKNTMAIAVLKELAAIILVNGHKPDEETKAKADEEGFPILLSSLSAFELVCKLHNIGIGKTGK